MRIIPEFTVVKLENNGVRFNSDIAITGLWMPFRTDGGVRFRVSIQTLSAISSDWLKWDSEETCALLERMVDHKRSRGWVPSEAGTDMLLAEDLKETQEKKPFSRYIYICGNVAMWAGDPATPDTPFVQVVITSNGHDEIYGTYQTYAVKGIGDGIVEGKLSIPKDTFQLVSDGDFVGLKSASEHADALVREYELQGFKVTTQLSEMRFQEQMSAQRQRIAAARDYMDKADVLAQDCVNIWGRSWEADRLAGRPMNSSLSQDFKDLLELAFRYRDARKLADNHREFGGCSEQDENGEKRTRLAFAEAYKKLEGKRE